jgi:hypothetical protein
MMKTSLLELQIQKKTNRPKHFRHGKRTLQTQTTHRMPKTRNPGQANAQQTNSVLNRNPSFK